MIELSGIIMKLWVIEPNKQRDAIVTQLVSMFDNGLFVYSSWDLVVEIIKPHYLDTTLFGLSTFYELTKWNDQLRREI